MNKSAVETTELATLDDRITAAIALTETATGRIGHVRAFASAARLVQQAVKDHWEDFEYLKNSPLGWKTDDKEYPPAVLQAALTDAIIRGAMPFNGEITVIAGNMYLSLPHFERVVRDRGNLSDVRIDFDVPEISGSRAIVGGVVSWRIDGQPGELRFKKTVDADTRIPVKINSGMGDDAILGKAKRKALAKMLSRIDGSGTWEEKAVDDERTLDATAKPALEAPKEPPSKSALKKSCGDFTEAIKAAKSTAEVKQIEQAIRSHEHFEHSPPGWRNVLDQWITHQLEAVADGKPLSTAAKLTTDELVARHAAEINHQATAKEVGEVQDQYLPPDDSNPHGFSLAQQKKMVAAFQARLVEVRPK